MKQQTVYVPVEGGKEVPVGFSKPLEGYFHTPEQLLELKKKWAAEAFDAGFEKCGENMIDHLIEITKPLPNKQTFLNSVKLD